MLLTVNARSGKKEYQELEGTVDRRRIRPGKSQCQQFFLYAAGSRAGCL